MATYEFRFIERQAGSVEVEADSEEQARELAIEGYFHGDVYWYGVDYEADLVAVRKTTEGEE